MKRFRTNPTINTAGTLSRIDHEAGIIRGVSVIQEGEALGHGLLIDDIMLKQVADLGNQAGDHGIKARYTHPGMCADGMGKMLGRVRNFNVSGDKVLADLHLLDSAAASPDGDLRGYILSLAKEDPAGFGLSIVFSGAPVWKLADGTEFAADDARPKDATTDMPFARADKLYAADAVDEPAANRDGLFSAALAAGSDRAADAFAQLDAWREEFGVEIETAQQFAERYFAARKPAEHSAMQKGDLMTITKVRLAELRKAHPEDQELIFDLFTADKTEQELMEALSAAKDARTATTIETLSAELGTIKAAHDATLKELAQAKEALSTAEKERDAAHALSIEHETARVELESATQELAEAKEALAVAEKERDDARAFGSGNVSDPGPDGEPAELTWTLEEFNAASGKQRGEFFKSGGIVASQSTH